MENSSPTRMDCSFFLTFPLSDLICVISFSPKLSDLIFSLDSKMTQYMQFSKLRHYLVFLFLSFLFQGIHQLKFREIRVPEVVRSPELLSKFNSTLFAGKCIGGLKSWVCSSSLCCLHIRDTCAFQRTYETNSITTHTKQKRHCMSNQLSLWAMSIFKVATGIYIYSVASPLKIAVHCQSIAFPSRK